MQEQMATGGGMMGPQPDPQKAFEVNIQIFSFFYFPSIYFLEQGVS